MSEPRTLQDKISAADERTLLGQKYSSIWYGLVGDMLDEAGYWDIQQMRHQGDLDVEHILAFFDKIKHLYKTIDLAADYSKLIVAGNAPDPEDIHKIGKRLEELSAHAPVAVEKLKSNIRKFLKEEL